MWLADNILNISGVAVMKVIICDLVYVHNTDHDEFKEKEGSTQSIDS